MNSIYGISIRVVNFKEQFKFPRTKKPRIQKKWRKNPQNWRDVTGLINYDQIKNVIYCSPDMLSQLKDRFFLKKYYE